MHSNSTLIGTYDAVDAITCEYIEGETLHSFLKKHKLNSLQQIQLIKKIAEELDEIHNPKREENPKLIHRDINLRNIILKEKKESKENFHIKITDFGLAEEVKDNKLQDTKFDCGSEFYMPPEVERYE